MNREQRRAKLFRLASESQDSSCESLLASSDLKIMDLEEMVEELKNALSNANEIDASAEGFCSANFAHKRSEFDSLCVKAGKMISHIYK